MSYPQHLTRRHFGADALCSLLVSKQKMPFETSGDDDRSKTVKGSPGT